MFRGCENGKNKAGIYFVPMNIFGIYQVVCCNKRSNKLWELIVLCGYSGVNKVLFIQIKWEKYFWFPSPFIVHIHMSDF